MLAADLLDRRDVPFRCKVTSATCELATRGLRSSESSTSSLASGGTWRSIFSNRFSIRFWRSSLTATLRALISMRIRASLVAFTNTKEGVQPPGIPDSPSRSSRVGERASLLGSRRCERADAGGDRGAGGYNVVHEHDRFRHGDAVPHGNRAQRPTDAGSPAPADLRPRITAACEALRDAEPRPTRERPSERARMIDSAAPGMDRMDRHRHDDAAQGLRRRQRRDLRRHEISYAQTTAELERADKRPRRAVVGEGRPACATG